MVKLQRCQHAAAASQIVRFRPWMVVTGYRRFRDPEAARDGVSTARGAPTVELQTSLSDVHAVFIVGDGWHDIEPESFEMGPWRIYLDDETHDMGPGFRFQSSDLGVVTGQVAIIGAVIVQPPPPARPLR